MASNQTYLFIVFTLVGIAIGILFDIFRILRKTFKTKDFITYIEDVIFWVLTGFIIIYSMYIFCDGELRFFMIIGIVLGTAIYMFTISRYVIKISVFIIDLLKKILITPITLVIKFIKKIVFRPIIIICINIMKFRRKSKFYNKKNNKNIKNIFNFVKKGKKNRGFFEKKEKYNIV